MGKYYPGVPNIIIFVLVQFPPPQIHTHTHTAHVWEHTWSEETGENSFLTQKVLQVISFILIF